MEDRSGMRGFAALASLTTDVSREVALADQIAKSAADRAREASAGGDAEATQIKATQGMAAPPASRGRAAGNHAGRVTIALIGGGVFLVIVIAALSNAPAPQSPTQSNGSTASSAVPSAPAAGNFVPPASPGTPSPDSGSSPFTATPPALVSPAAAPEEELPPVGSGTLTLPQLRWCRFEDVRLEAMRSLLDRTNETHVSTFNVFVKQYNSRCPGTRYYTDDGTRVEQELAQRREELQREAAARLQR